MRVTNETSDPIVKKDPEKGIVTVYRAVDSEIVDSVEYEFQYSVGLSIVCPRESPAIPLWVVDALEEIGGLKVIFATA